MVAIDPITQGTQFDAGDLEIDFSSTSFVAAVASCGGSGLPDLGQNEIWINGYGSAGGFVSTQPDGTAFVSDVSCGTEDVFIQAFTRDYKAASRLVRRRRKLYAPHQWNRAYHFRTGPDLLAWQRQLQLALPGRCRFWRGRILPATQHHRTKGWHFRRWERRYCHLPPHSRSGIR